jgi:hypothetical protein
MTQNNVVKLEQPARPQETDEEAMSRIRERFDILHEMTKASIRVKLMKSIYVTTVLSIR